MNIKEIGHRIREQRIKNNMTLEVLAEKTNLSVLHIGHIERGARTPSLASFIKIAQCLNISMDYLIFGEVGEKGAEYHEHQVLVSKCSKSEMELINGIIRLMLNQKDRE